MKPAHIKEQRQKEIRKIYKRFRAISEEHKELGYRELDHPIRYGWFKETVLTHKIERYKNYELLIKAFNACKIEIWGPDKGKADIKWVKQEKYHLVYKGFQLMSRNRYNKLPDNEKRLFSAYHYKNCKGKWRYKYYPLLPKDSYRTKYTRAYVTHSKIIDPKLESEDALLDAQLLKPGYYELDNKYRCRHLWWYNERSRRKKSKQELSQLNSRHLESETIDLLWQN